MRFRCKNCGELLETDVSIIECPICKSKQKNPALLFPEVGEHDQILKRRPSLSVDGNTAEIREARRLATSRQPLVCGIFATYAFTDYGLPYACGSNTAYNFYSKSEEPCGQCEVGNSRDVVQIVCAPDHAFLLRSDGKVIVLGDKKKYNTSKWTDIVQVATGVTFGLGLKADGTVVTCGITNTPYCRVEGWRDIVAIYCSNVHTVGLKKDGTVLAIGTLTKDNWDIAQGREGGQCDVGGWTDIVEIACGNESTIGLKADGTVVACGSDTKFNDAGTVDLPCSRLEVQGWTDIVAITCSQHHTLGLKADGTVVACGDNTYGQCNVSEWTDIVEVVCGQKHTLGLKADGTVVACGDNSVGQCNVSGWKNVVDIACGWAHTVCTRADGTVVACGSSYRKGKQQNKEENVYCDRLAVHNWEQVGANTVLLALRLLAKGKKHAADYLLYTYSDYGEGHALLERIRGGEELTEYAKQKISEITSTFRAKIDAEAARIADMDKVWALKHEQYVFAKAEAVRRAAEKQEEDRINLENKRLAEYNAKINESKQLIAFAEYLKKKGVFSGNTYAMAGLRETKAPVFFEDNRKSKQNVTDTDVKSVACGEMHTVCLKANGTVIAFGKNEDGRCLTSSWRDITDIACGECHTVALKSDGVVVAFGSNVIVNPDTFEEQEIGQCKVSEWSDIVAIACGAYHTVGLKKDGTVVACGSNVAFDKEKHEFVRRGQCMVNEWTDIVQIACGSYFTVGLKKDGTMVACGDNTREQCKVGDLMDILQIACGEDFLLALRKGGFVACCGGNSGGKCDVKGWKNMVYIAACKDSSYGLKSDGSIVACGKFDRDLLKITDFRMGYGLRFEALSALAEGKQYAAAYLLGLINGGDPLVRRIRVAKENLHDEAAAEVLSIERAVSAERERKEAVKKEIASLTVEIPNLKKELEELNATIEAIKGIFSAKKKKPLQEQALQLQKTIEEKENRLSTLVTEKTE